MKTSFIDYSDASKELMKKVFGEELYNKLATTPLTGFDWDGIDLTTCHILATTFGIKDRFSKEKVSYHTEQGRTALDLLISSIFHYGFEQACNTTLADYESHAKSVMKMAEILKKNLDKALAELKQFKGEEGESIEAKMNRMMVNLIDARFLELVEKWARYDGERFDIGDIDVVVENMGTFVQTSESPKMLFGDDAPEGQMFGFSKTEKDISKTIYDVTLVKNNAACTKYDKRVLIAERYPDYYTEEKKKKRPANIYVFSVDEDYDEYKADDGQYTSHPTFERLKKDFEEGNYKPYHSLIYNFCGEYRLARYNDNSDRIACLSGIYMDLDWLEIEEEAKKLSNHIEIVPRLGNMTDVKRHELLKKDLEDKK